MRIKYLSLSLGFISLFQIKLTAALAQARRQISRPEVSNIEYMPITENEGQEDVSKMTQASNDITRPNAGVKSRLTMSGFKLHRMGRGQTGSEMERRPIAASWNAEV
ncbi:hypothetical protein V1527DRAFT_45844 [Lipomyces starkeyi]